MHVRIPILWALLSCLPSAASAAPAILMVNDLGDAGDGTCTGVCTLRDAITGIAAGGTIDFDNNMLPGTINLTKGQISVTKPFVIQGPGAGRLAVSAGGTSSLFQLTLPPSSTIRIADITLRDGALIGSDGADGAAGISPSEDGKDGAGGYAAEGACISVTSFFATGTLILDGVDVRNCVAQGGNGGKGGAGAASVGGLTAGGAGGRGGHGGFAGGACIWFMGLDGMGNGIGDLIVRNSSVTNCQTSAGDGGAGGDGGSAPLFHGIGGAGGTGAGAFGGAVEFWGNALMIRNSTIADAAATAGTGAGGGTGDGTYTLYPGGAGGDGGDAAGGLVFATGDTGTGSLEFATLASGDVHAGDAGSGGSGAAHGADGKSGQPLGADFFGDEGFAFLNYVALSTAIVGTSVTPLCSGLFGAFGSINLAEHDSCPSNLQGTLAQVFRPLDSSRPLPAYMPVYHSTVTDAAASCNDSTLDPVTADQHSTPRPQGSACDIGAIEADYIFVGEFD